MRRIAIAYHASHTKGRASRMRTFHQGLRVESVTGAHSIALCGLRSVSNRMTYKHPKMRLMRALIRDMRAVHCTS